MKLKELILVLDRKTKVCVCGEMGAYTKVDTLDNISIKDLLWTVDAEVDHVYIDPEDGSLTIELADHM